MRINLIFAVGTMTLGAAACVGDGREGRPDDDFPPSLTAGAGSTEGGGDGSEEPGDGSDPDRLDVGGGAETAGGDGGEPQACEKIDFLFVVDNSGSMYDEQQNLVDSFPGFIDAIEASTGARDFQIMVVDTDDYQAPGEGGFVECDPDPMTGLNCCPEACAMYPYLTCNGVPCTPGGPPSPSGCDQMLGAGRRAGATGFDCGVQGDDRFVRTGQSDLRSTFACLAQVGVGGEGNERPMEAMSTAIGPMNGAGECNGGFVRDDAILVVTIITDEEDDQETATACDQARPLSGSAGDPTSWHQAVVAAKQGVEENAVVLALAGPTDAASACPALDKCNGGIVGAEPTPRIEEFAQTFSRGLVGPVCAPSFDPFFEHAISLITEACDQFVPPA